MFCFKTTTPIKIFINIIFISVMLQGQMFSQTVLEKNNNSKIML